MSKIWVTKNDGEAVLFGRSKAILFALCLSTSGIAQSEDADDADKYTFFSQPNVTRDRVLADYDECRELASSVQPPPPGYVYTQGLAGAAAAGFFQGLVKGAQRRHMFDAAFRKCMSVNGYQRFATTKEDADSLYSGSWSEMREKLAARALAPVAGNLRLDP